MCPRENKLGREFSLTNKQVNSPLIRLITALAGNLKSNLDSNDSLHPGFFGTAPLKKTIVRKKRIIEETISSLGKLTEQAKKNSLNNSLQQLGEILLNAKFQFLKFYTEPGEKLNLNALLDSSITIFLKKAQEISPDHSFEHLFKSQLLLNQAIAINHLFKIYNEKILSMCIKMGQDKKALRALTRFQEQLKKCNATFISGLARFVPIELLEKQKNFCINPQLHQEMATFLLEQQNKMWKLEPGSNDMKVAEVLKVYQWGFTAISKLGAYLRSINEQIRHILNENLPANPAH